MDLNQALSLSLCSSVDDSIAVEFQDFKKQLFIVQDLVDTLNDKIVSKSLCRDDLTVLQEEMNNLAIVEEKVTSDKMKSYYISYKTLSLKMIQESYRICSWLVEKECSEIDNLFTIDSFIENIFQACAGKEDPLHHINTLFDDVLKNVNYLNLNFYGNTSPEENTEPIVSTQLRKEIRRSQKRPLEDLTVPDEVENTEGDNELQTNLLTIRKCLEEAMVQNGGEPILFFKFAVDPFSLTYTIQNFFNLASLLKDNYIKINRANDDSLSTIVPLKKENGNISVADKDGIISIFTINEDLWKFYIKKYQITERMIDQDQD